MPEPSVLEVTLDVAGESQEIWRKFNDLVVQMSQRNLIQQDWMAPLFREMIQHMNNVSRKHQYLIVRLTNLMENLGNPLPGDSKN